jgi:hypothetical protein
VSAFRLYLRNSPVRWAVPILVVLDVAILFLRSRYWIGVWPQAGAAAQVPAYLLGPLVAGAAAWAAAATQRHGMTEQLASARVPIARREAYRLGATLVWLTVPYGTGQLIAVVLTARTLPPGFGFWVGYAVLGLFVTAAAIALGWSIGSVSTSVFSTLAAALTWVIVFGLMQRALRQVVVSGDPEREVSPAAVTVRLALVCALVGALLWYRAPGRSTRRRAWVPATIVLPGVGWVVFSVNAGNREAPRSSLSETDAGAVVNAIRVRSSIFRTRHPVERRSRKDRLYADGADGP